MRTFSTMLALNSADQRGGRESINLHILLWSRQFNKRRMISIVKKLFLGIVLLLIGLVLNIHMRQKYLTSLASLSQSKQVGAALTIKILFLNETTPEKLNRSHQQFINRSSTKNLEGTFDILSISSKFNLKLPHAQHETFIQHPSVRNFIIATEDDDPDPW